MHVLIKNRCQNDRVDIQTQIWQVRYSTPVPFVDVYEKRKVQFESSESALQIRSGQHETVSHVSLFHDHGPSRRWVQTYYSIILLAIFSALFCTRSLAVAAAKGMTR
jgi:hypothetical protein